jgi:hypothetical protein
MHIDEKTPASDYRSLQQIARRFPPGKQDKPVHPATLTKWIRQGIALSDGSKLRLRAVRFPAGWRTRTEWVDEFLEAITADRIGAPAHDPAHARRADAALAATGW